MPVLRRPVEPAVKTGNTRGEQMFSALPLRADIAQTESACPFRAMNGLLRATLVLFTSGWEL